MPDIRRQLKKFVPHLVKAKQDSLNEADTVQRLVLFLTEVLGYDPLTEITRESQIKEKYVDVAVKIDGTIRWLIEAKAANVPLRSRHLDQAELYAAEGNYPWVVVTNGVAWRLYHLTFDEGIEYEQVFEVDLESTEADRAAEMLGLLHRAAILKGAHEEYLRHRQALDPESLAKALFSYEVLSLTRRTLRKREGVLLDVEDVASAIKELFTQEAREQIGVVKIQRRRRLRKKPEAEPAPQTDGLSASQPTPPPTPNLSPKPEATP